MLYGVEVIPIKDSTMKFLDMQQRIMGEVILEVPTSSANACVETELGLRPVSEVIVEKKLSFYSYLETNVPGSKIVREMFLLKRETGTLSLLRRRRDCRELIHPVEWDRMSS